MKRFTMNNLGDNTISMAPKCDHERAVAETELCPSKMVATFAVIQWFVALAIFVIAFRHSYRADRITGFSVLFTWAALTLEMLAFAGCAHSLSRDDREHWANSFPDGQHFLGMLLIAGWLNGLLVSIVAVGVRRLIRGSGYFNGSGNESKNA